MHIGEYHSLQEAEEFGMEFLYAASSEYSNKPLYNFKCYETGFNIPLWNLNNHSCNAKHLNKDGFGACGDVFGRMRLALDRVAHTR